GADSSGGFCLNVVIVGLAKALSSAVPGVADLFGLAGVPWTRIQGQPAERLFNVRIASPEGQPVQCINGIRLGAHLSYDQVQDVDAIVVPTIGGPVTEVVEHNPA